MKTKSLSFILSLAFLVLTTLALTSALTINLPSAIELNQNSNSATFTLTFNNLANVNVINSSSNVVITNTTTLNNITTATFRATASSIPLGTTSAYVNFFASNVTDSNDNSTAKYTFNLKNTTNPLCSGTNPGELYISDNEFNLVEGFGDEDEPFFYPLDEVEYSFNVDNQGDYDIENIEITACLWDVSAGKCIIKESKMDISDDEFDLDSGDDIDVTISFDIDPNKLKAGNTEYLLYVGAKGEINDKDAPDALDGTLSCTSDFDDLEIVTDDEFVILSNFDVPELITCNSEFEITAEIWNVGKNDLDSDEVYIEVYNSALGIREQFEFTNDFDAMDKQLESFILKAPSTAVADKTYSLLFTVYNDDSYSDSDIYENQEDDLAEFDVLIKISSCVVPAKATITAELSSETPTAVIGKQVAVEATIKNTGSTTETFTIEISGNSQWSSLADIDSKTLTLNAGESKTSTVYLDISKDASIGEESFVIKATSSSGVSTEKEIVLSLEKGFSTSKILEHLKAKWYIYLIVLVNLLLLIAIILVIVRIVRKSK